jgi:hypothetical protein
LLSNNYLFLRAFPDPNIRKPILASLLFILITSILLQNATLKIIFQTKIKVAAKGGVKVERTTDYSSYVKGSKPAATDSINITIPPNAYSELQ